MNKIPGFKWNDAEALLARDFNAFNAKYSEGTKRKPFEFKNAVFNTDEPQRFDFDYEVGQRLHSNEPRCYQGVYMPPATPTCNFKCEGRDCFLNGPAPPNDGKRMLQESR
jgi:hypothetical protein